MKNFETMPTPKKMLAGATTMVALSGFVPAIEAASPTATANVGVSVVIQQAITITVGAPVNFGTIILSAATVVGSQVVYASSNANVSLVGSTFLIGGGADISAKPTPGTYNTKSYTVTVTDI